MRFFVMAAFLVMISVADAEELALPIYDVDEQCAKVAGAGGTYSEEIKGACMESEQAAYDSLKEDWDNVSLAMQSRGRSSSRGRPL